MKKEKTYSSEYLKKLSEFPNRGIGTEFEKAATDYVYRIYSNMGLKAFCDEFNTIWSGMSIYPLTYLILTIASLFFFVLHINVLAIILLIVVVSMHFRLPNYSALFRLIVPRKAHNVYAKLVAPEAKSNIVLVGHVDTAHETLFVKHYGKVFGGFLRHKLDSNKGNLKTGLNSMPIVQSPYGFFNFGLIIYIIALITQSLILEYVTLIILGTFIILMLFYLIHVAFTPFVNGALDNASGVSIVMAMARYFSQNKPKNINLYFVNSSSEENYFNGLHLVLSKLDLPREDTYIVNFDTVASDYLVAGYSESDSIGFTKSYEKAAYSSFIRFVRSKQEYKNKVLESHCPFASDMTEARKLKYKIVTTLFSLSKNGPPEQYHQKSDTLKLINWETLDLVENLTRDYIEYLDKNS